MNVSNINGPSLCLGLVLVWYNYMCSVKNGLSWVMSVKIKYIRASLIEANIFYNLLLTRSFF